MARAFLGLMGAIGLEQLYHEEEVQLTHVFLEYVEKEVPAFPRRDR